MVGVFRYLMNKEPSPPDSLRSPGPSPKRREHERAAHLSEEEHLADEAKTAEKTETPEKPSGTEILSAAAVTLSESETAGRVKLEIRGEKPRTYDGINALPAFPLT